MRHFGIHRTGITLEQAKLDKLAVKTLFRWGAHQLSVLSNKCQVRVTDPAWTECVARLVSYGLAEEYERRGQAFVRLTGEGQEWGLDLTCELYEDEDNPVPGSQREADRLARQGRQAREAE